MHLLLMKNLIVTGTTLRHRWPVIFIGLLEFYNVKSVPRIHIHVLGKANLYLSLRAFWRTYLASIVHYCNVD